jgi:uncharacterized protein
MRTLSCAAHAAVLFIALLFAYSPAWSAEVERQALAIVTDGGERNFMVEIADDNRARALGLMFRRSMPDDEGMLFDFFQEEPASFWMRNTYISLDMLFIKADGTIESIAKRTTPLSERSVQSKSPVRYVLEINGGLSDTLGIKPGDKASGPALERKQ